MFPKGATNRFGGTHFQVLHMNILHVVPFFEPAWAYGGTPRTVTELCHALKERGHNITVLTTDAFDARSRIHPSHETLKGIEVFRLRNLSNYLAWHNQAFLPIGFASFLRNRLQEFDTVHLHTLRTALNVLAHRYAAKYGIEYVLSGHGSVSRIVRRRSLKAIFDWVAGERLLRDASRLIAQSNVEKSEYETAGVPGSKIAIVFNGVDSSTYEKLPSPGSLAKSLGLDGKRLVTYLGRLSPGKGLDDLLTAFRDIARGNDDFVLIIAGPDDGYRARLMRLARQLSISDRVFFPGFVAMPEKLSLFVDSDLIVYPASHESFGLVPVEALLCGTPIVVSRDSGCGELIERAQAGITFPSGNVSLLREAILTSLKEDQAIREMVRRGRDFVVQQLNWNRIAEEMEQIYEATASGAT